MTSTNAKRILAAVSFLGLAACGQEPGAGLGTARGALTSCYTTADALVCRKEEVETEHGRTFVKVEDEVRALYPSACLDRDADGDGVPDFLDDGSIGAGGSGGVDDSGHHTGLDDSGHHAGSVDDGSAGAGGSGGSDGDGNGIDDAIQCRRCERGPGEPGELRFEVRDGDEARLQRGTVLSVDASGLTVATVSGPLAVLVDPASIEGGVPTPGAEVRAEGVLEPGGALAMRATRLELLCPGPTALDAGAVPVGASPVPGASGDDDGTPDQGSGDR